MANLLCSTIGHTSGGWLWNGPCVRCGAVPGRRAAPVARPPVKCPVCEGRGTVPHDFYAQLGASSSTTRETCRSCQGRGIV